MKFRFLFFLILFILTIQISAQNKTSEWTRYSSDNTDLSFELPTKPTYFYDKDGFSYSSVYADVFHFSEMQMLHSSVDDTYFCVEIYKVLNPDSYLDDLAQTSGLVTSKINSDVKGFTVKSGKLNKKFPRVEKIIDRVNYETRLVASKSHLYIFTTWNRGKSKPDSERFISSIKLSSTKTPDDKAVSIKTLKPITVEEIGETLAKEKAKTLPDKSEIESENSDDLTILLLPYPRPSNAARNRRAAGSVKYLVKYGDNGQIEQISLISDNSSGFDRNAFFSVLRIKFLPKISGGKPIATERVLSFSFNRRSV